MSVTDANMIAILKASILNIGRLLPYGYEITFYREDGDDRARMFQLAPDGTGTEYAFTLPGDIFDVTAAGAKGDSIKAALMEMDAKAPTPIAQAIHYPDCWDTTAYPDLESALRELAYWFLCSNQECNGGAASVVRSAEGTCYFPNNAEPTAIDHQDDGEGCKGLFSEEERHL